MKLSFIKYHGGGNDFVIVDALDPQALSNEQVAFLCHRRYGIGADGLITIHSGTEEYDFEIRYYNSDGALASLCGNGSRCALDYAYKHQICAKNARFKASDGIHKGVIISDVRNRVSMLTVTLPQQYDDGYFLNTGSPHFVVPVENAELVDVEKNGKELRSDARFVGGTNVNFMERHADHLFVRTYERGVEAETLSCGTGVTASAIVAASLDAVAPHQPVHYQIKTLGGLFTVYLQREDELFNQIWLEGPVQSVFKGSIQI
ncbi:MAG TPA: diaminopimelate epimerase [Bacteroidales bacterium]|nr:diaminopimelate epimerase [Bacteroidales bacterium]HOH23347.1 diaminopimelate epimerase [Bacteroidales bacterium]HPZ04063.1 diaminopimelate epimerase [Bacteroidales bacterium]HQB75917.1 diaminopimelate epimerase [Bacteroidales bacterium]